MLKNKQRNDKNSSRGSKDVDNPLQDNKGSFKFTTKLLKKAKTKVIDVFQINKLSPSIEGQLYKMMTSLSYGIWISLCIFYALFIDDIRIMLIPPSFDFYIDLFTSFVMLMFIIEIFGSIWIFEGYICSFYFFLDLISTITMIFDVGFFSSNKFLKNDSFDNYSRIQANY